MKTKLTRSAYRKAARLILKRRYGRACRVVARAYGTSPRLLVDLKARHEWAERNQ